MDPVEVLNGLIGLDADPSLSEHERKVCLLNSFEAETLNGGWEQYLWNSSGDQAEELLPYLSEFGYEATVEGFALLRQAMGGQIPRDRAERIRRLDGLRPDLALRQRIHDLIDEDVTDIFDDICAYIREHEAEFTRAPRP